MENTQMILHFHVEKTHNYGLMGKNLLCIKRSLQKYYKEAWTLNFTNSARIEKNANLHHCNTCCMTQLNNSHF